MQKIETVTANSDNDRKYFTSGMANEKDKNKKKNEFQESVDNQESKIEYFTE